MDTLAALFRVGASVSVERIKLDPPTSARRCETVADQTLVDLIAQDWRAMVVFCGVIAAKRLGAGKISCLGCGGRHAGKFGP